MPRTSTLASAAGLAGILLLATLGAGPRAQPGEAPAGLTVDGGARLPQAPAWLPNAPLPPGSDPIDLANERIRQGNLVGATNLLAAWLDGAIPDLTAREGRRRWYGARFLLGLLQLQQGHANLASRQFTKVHAAKGALASEAAWYEAKADHLRGRHSVAARECARYRERWPQGSHRADCLLLEGDALTAAGTFQPAHDAYQAFIDLDPDGPDVELAELGQAQALANRSPRRAVAELQARALDYSYPTTRTAALASLAKLEVAGLDTTIPDDRSSRMRLAFSALRAREYSRARELWGLLQADPEASNWVAEHRETFGWRTRDYAALVELFSERYQANASPDTAWLAHRAASRGGLWDQAAAWGERGLTEHSKHWRWRAAQDDVAWARMLAGDLTGAQALWDQLATRGGSRGREAAWFGAFCAWRAGELADAAQRLDRIRGSDSARATQAQYYLGRVAEAGDEPDQARQHYQAVLQRDPHGWYGLLARTRLEPPGQGPAWLIRSGAWPYAQPAQPESLGPMPVRAPPSQVQPPGGNATSATLPRILQRALPPRPPSFLSTAWPGHPHGTTER